MSTVVQALPAAAPDVRAEERRDVLLPVVWSGFPVAGLLIVAAYSAAGRGGGNGAGVEWLHDQCSCTGDGAGNWPSSDERGGLAP